MSFRGIGNDGRPLGEPVLAAFLDEKTGFMWAATDASNSRMTYSDAKQAASKFRCAGFDDWHLPTIAELETLRDLTRHDPAADPALGLKSASYWSSTPLASSPGGCAWVVDFGYGTVDFDGQGSTAFVRLVRSSRASQ